MSIKAPFNRFTAFTDFSFDKLDLEDNMDSQIENPQIFKRFELFKKKSILIDDSADISNDEKLSEYVNYKYAYVLCQDERFGFKGNTFEEYQSLLHKKEMELSPVEKEVKNLLETLRTVFSGGNCCAKQKAFTVELIQEIHSKLMCGIVDDGGVFRKVTVRSTDSAGFPYHFRHFTQIKNDLEDLVLGVKNWPINEPLDAFRRAAVFLSRFLYIHPFRDGNGRTARILTSILLADYCIVPIAIGYKICNSREIYLKCLLQRDNRPQNGLIPGMLLSLLVESCNRFSEEIYYSTADTVNDKDINDTYICLSST
eukprot:NODE_738_length_4687_cov_0.308849.p1 type:complete len:312 gc:universal NODE_738_length_4687_cov_0.308849:377-1312(+)